MDRFEEIIGQNRDQFDGSEPEDGHFKRFSQKMQNRNKRIMRFSPINILKAASVVLLITLSSLWIYDNILRSSETGRRMSLGDISPEYQEVEIYYTGLVKSKYNEIDQVSFPEDSTQKMILKRELSDMDSIYKSLEKELGINPTDERIIHAMIEHYQRKLEVMNHILDQLYQLENQKQNKDTNHESTDV
ncbi:MAG: hypothetical protein JSV24_04235 [Bacteroidales bacterium]|nr:MAG: hypothetical protein JSV24_04235 [Bacteroidales bacterium]